MAINKELKRQRNRNYVLRKMLTDPNFKSHRKEIRKRYELKKRNSMTEVDVLIKRFKGRTYQQQYRQRKRELMKSNESPSLHSDRNDHGNQQTSYGNGLCLQRELKLEPMEFPIDACDQSLTTVPLSQSNVGNTIIVKKEEDIGTSQCSSRKRKQPSRFNDYIIEREVDKTLPGVKTPLIAPNEVSTSEAGKSSLSKIVVPHLGDQEKRPCNKSPTNSSRGSLSYDDLKSILEKHFQNTRKKGKSYLLPCQGPAFSKPQTVDVGVQVNTCCHCKCTESASANSSVDGATHLCLLCNMRFAKETALDEHVRQHTESATVSLQRELKRSRDREYRKRKLLGDPDYKARRRELSRKYYYKKKSSMTENDILIHRWKRRVYQKNYRESKCEEPHSSGCPSASPAQ